jgi:hypothetical protein
MQIIKYTREPMLIAFYDYKNETYE